MNLRKKSYIKVNIRELNRALKYNVFILYILMLQTLKLIKRKNLVLGLIQEDSIENSVQDSLPYILKPHGSC